MTTVTRAFAPATVANLAVGFDVLGLALAPLDGSAWGDVVVVRDSGPGKAPGFAVAGPHGSDLPADPKTNVVPAVAERFLAVARDRGLAPRTIDLVLEAPPGLVRARRLRLERKRGAVALSAISATRSREELLPLAGWAASRAARSTSTV